MKYYKIKYLNGDHRIVKGKNSLDIVKRYDLASRDNINTRLIELCGFTPEISKMKVEDYEASLSKKIKILEKKLEMSKHREERLCSDHSGKQLGQHTGCIACDVEYYSNKDKEAS